MKRFRLPLLAIGAVMVLVVVAVAVAFTSTFQTWVARKALAGRPGMGASVGSVSAGMKRVELKDLRFVRENAVLTIPVVELELPMMTASWDKKLLISRLVAKGWTLDLSGTGAGDTATVSSTTNESSPASPRSPTAAGAVGSNNLAARTFAGIFGGLEVPVDLALDGVDLEGNVVLPASRGRVAVTLKGGGLSAGHEGKFDLSATATLADQNVNVVETRGGLSATMDTARTFTRVAARLDSAASGPKLATTVKLHTELAATRTADGESYHMAALADGQELVALDGALAPTAKSLVGTWKLDVRDTDLVPFALGQPMPAFTAVGEGKFETDRGFQAVRATGRLNSTLDRLQVVRPELAGVGELKVAADFDLAERSGTISVDQLEIAINAAQPVATVRTLQAFEFTPERGELRTSDAQRELVTVALHAVPVGWLNPFLQPFELRGASLRGEMSAMARNGGMTLRSTSPLEVNDLSVNQGAKEIVKSVDVALNASADHTPQGWQAEVTGLTVKQGAAHLLALDAKAGQLAGRGQPLKATGRITADVAAVLRQPIAAGVVTLTSGEAGVDFVVSLNAQQEVQAKVALKNLAVVEKETVKLPNVTANVRADFLRDGKIAFNAPIQVERNERTSDLTISGTIGPLVDKARAIDADVASAQLVMEDAQVFAALVAEHSDKSGARRDIVPAWAGLHGSVGLKFQHVIYSDAFEVSNVSGKLRLDAGTLKLEGLQAGLGGQGRANLNGSVTFSADAPQPYALAADMAVKEFDPGPLLRALNRNLPATIEGKFDVTSRLFGRSGTLSDLAWGAGGNFQLTSKGGVFRGLPVNVTNIVENTSKLAAWIASGLNAVTGKKDTADIASKAEAVAEVARGLNAIAYDQLSVLVLRDAALNTSVKNLTLIAPEVRLTGNGTALHKPGSSLLEDPLAMEYTLRARGRQGELLKYLGALETQTDDLGYAACTVPFKVGGSLGNPDTSELNGKLTALAIEKSGFGDKAAEFLSRIRGTK